MADNLLQLVRAEVDASASQLHQSATAVTAVASTLGGCTFSATTAGRIYSSQGSSVQTGLQTVAKTVTAWAAGDDTAGDALKAAAARLESTDVTNSSSVSAVS